jgi:hypothetical protein
MGLSAIASVWTGDNQTGVFDVLGVEVDKRYQVVTSQSGVATINDKINAMFDSLNSTFTDIYFLPVRQVPLAAAPPTGVLNGSTGEDVTIVLQF